MIIGGSNTVQASTQYSTLFAGIAQGNAFFNTNYLKYCAQLTGPAERFQVNFLEGFPLPTELNGEVTLKNPYARTMNGTTKPFDASIEIEGVKYRNSPNLVGVEVNQFVGGQTLFLNTVAVNGTLNAATSLIGFDGVAVASTAHPRVGGLSNQSNLTTNTLTQLTFQSALVAMRQFTDVAGRPLYVNPKKLIVHPALEVTARQIIETQVRFQGGSSTAGQVDAGTIVAAAAVDNIASKYGVELVVEPQLTNSGFWAIVGENGPATPFVFGLAKGPYPVDNLNQWTGDDLVKFSIRADAAVMPGQWQTIYVGNPP